MRTEPQREQRKAWTVMFYMAASLNDRTEQAAILDLEELQRVSGENSKLKEHVNLLVQIDRRWPGYAERYCIERGQSTFCEARYNERNVRDPDKNSGNRKVLKEFVQWGRKHSPAEHYMLVLWGHQYGLGFGRDHGNPLTLPEIEGALSDALKGEKIDILGANACAMSYVEAAYQLQNVADFLVAPEIAMPLAGWPYDKILAEIVNNPDIGAQEFGKTIVQRFMASFTDALEPRSVSLTLLNLKLARGIKDYLSGLTKEVTAVIERDDALKQHIADAFLDTAHGDERPLIDLADLCDRLSVMSKSASDDKHAFDNVVSAAERLREFLKDGAKKFVVYRDASPELDGMHGVGIFAPSVTGAAALMRLEESEEQYRKLKLVTDTGWASLAYDCLKDLLDPVNQTVAEFVSGTSASTREDRFGVAQLLVGIHRSFVRLEQTVGETEKEVVRGLNGNGSTRVGMRKSHKSGPAATVFGWPFLRLVPDPGPLYSGGGLSPDGKRPLARRSQAAANGDRLLEFVRPFAKLEEALANVERTVKRVTTHTRLGLGAEPPKTDLGAEPPKTDLGAEPPKTDLGAEPPKTDLGLFPRLSDGDGGFPSEEETSTVTTFYRHVARSLKLVEEALARAENDVVMVIRREPSGSNGEYRVLTKAVINQSFRDLHEVASSARRTIITVLANPGNGLGPPPLRGEPTISRQQLAIAGGLSSRELRLLAVPVSDR